MARIDDYQQALGLVREGLSGKDPDRIAGFSGAKLLQDSQGNMFLSFIFLNQEITVSWPELVVSGKQAEGELPIQQQVLLLHYLLGAVSGRGPRVTGEWIAFQDIPDGRFYLDAFLKRAKMPLVSTFGAQPEKLVALAVKAYGASPFDHGDFSVLVKALPLTHVALILWKGDEEFPPEGNVLFDQNISRILSAEDIAWLAGMIVYPLIGMAGA
jgi:Domain of unknown function (DUF3786)